MLRSRLPPSEARLKSWCEICAENGFECSDAALAAQELDSTTVPQVVCDLLAQLQAKMGSEVAEEATMADALQWLATWTNTAAKYTCTEAPDESEGDAAELSERLRRRHYALGFAEYTHFTSPIRRYADLLVHRLLRAVLAAEAAGGGAEALRSALDEQGVGLEAVRKLVERTNGQAQGAKYAQQDCGRLLALRYAAETGGKDGLLTEAVVMSADQNNLKLR